MSPSGKVTSDPSSPDKTAFRVVFLVGSDNRSTRAAIEAVCDIPGVIASAILLDTGRTSAGNRLRNLRRNLRRNGWRYIPYRILEALRRATDQLADRAVLRPGEVEAVLRKAFPTRCFTLDDIAGKYGCAAIRAGDLNGPAAAQALRTCGADLGIVLGTRVLRPSCFSVPRLGSINLHKGKVPEYRGMPPGFWELFDGAKTAGVTVHFVDSRLDTGDVVAAGEVPISPKETPDSLLEKLHVEGARMLVRAVDSIRSGDFQRKTQAVTSHRAHTRPTLAEEAALRRRLPHWSEQSAPRAITRNLIYLTIFCSGIHWLLRAARKRSRAAIILYHRVNDYSRDPLTVDTETFAAQLLLISKYYMVMTSEELVRRLRNHETVPPTTVLIHFDDAYRDVHTEGRPILQAVGIPATAFISSGFVDTNRRFAHDEAKYPFHFENCHGSDIRQWLDARFEIGAHTVNHVDLGTVSGDGAREEIFSSRSDLEAIGGRPVSLFSFPFGMPRNITPEAVRLVREAGYEALFSAHGGTVEERTDVWDIPRFGISWVHKPLSLMMEIEECSLPCLASRLNARVRKPDHSPVS